MAGVGETMNGKGDKTRTDDTRAYGDGWENTYKEPFRGTRVLRDGEWENGRAGPKLLPEQMRNKPGEILTEDPDDASKIHELDPEHIVDAIEYDHEKAKHADLSDDRKKDIAELFAKFDAPVGEVVPLNQARVYGVIMRVIFSLIDAWSAAVDRGEDAETAITYHLWFPDNNVNKYELRKGLPPAPSQRPRHLQHLNLVVDPFDPPQMIRDAYAQVGVNIPTFRDSMT